MVSIVDIVGGALVTQGSAAAGNDTNNRPTTRKYVPNDRFMITVTKSDEYQDDDNGIQIVEHNGDFYVADIISGGPFFPTAIDVGDKILSINGKKVNKDIKSLDQGLTIMDSKPKITLFMMRLERDDPGYKWVIDTIGGGGGGDDYYEEGDDDDDDLD